MTVLLIIICVIEPHLCVKLDRGPFCFAFPCIVTRRLVYTAGQADSLAKGPTEIHTGPYAAAITPVLTQMKPASGDKNSGTDEPVYRAEIETQTQRMGMDAAVEGKGRRTGERH